MIQVPCRIHFSKRSWDRWVEKYPAYEVVIARLQRLVFFSFPISLDLPTSRVGSWCNGPHGPTLVLHSDSYECLGELLFDL